MKIYIFLAEGFEEIEAIAPIDIFRRAGIETISVSIYDHLQVLGAHNIIINADNTFKKTDFSGEFLIYLPGGMPGTTNLEKHEELLKLILKHAENGGKIAAICAAPLILGKLNLLQGKTAICYPGYENYLYGSKLSSSKIVKTENIFTAKAAGVAIKFALQIVAEIKGTKIAEQIQQDIFLD
ncbi:MAG: DJ-1/PfpI family protein [Paludibacter sp.]|jgi:4-methyl-5(b-hydroxyethyl)-thiazole monophosphate biosynthesis|nr:DJ-1/PfpI family protein [Paludibacter sp.]